MFENSVDLKFLVRAFKYRNYRLFFAGQSVSLIGTWMQIIAMSWLVYRLTNSAFLLGAVGFASQIPIFLLTPFAGVFADHFDRKRILIITQTFSMIQALVLTILAFANVIAIWQLFALGTLLGVINAFDIPARQAFVVDLVEKKEDLGNAIALNSFMFNGARLVGPSVAGIIISLAGEGLCFLINSISFLAVIFALLGMKTKIKEIYHRKNPLLKGLREGFVYTFGSARIRYILLLVTLVSVMGMSYMILMPVFASKILQGGARTFGFLMGAAGLGALIGALYLAPRKNAEGLERISYIAAIIFGAGIIAFSFSRVLWLSLSMILCASFGLMVQMVSSNTVLQHFTDDDKRGRVMSFFATAFLGMAPFGSLLAGAIANKMGAPNALLISGILCIIGALFFWRRCASFSK